MVDAELCIIQRDFNPIFQKPLARVLEIEQRQGNRELQVHLDPFCLAWRGDERMDLVKQPLRIAVHDFRLLADFELLIVEIVVERADDSAEERKAKVLLELFRDDCGDKRFVILYEELSSREANQRTLHLQSALNRQRTNEHHSFCVFILSTTITTKNMSTLLLHNILTVYYSKIQTPFLDLFLFIK